MYFQLIIAHAGCCFVICYQKEQQATINQGGEKNQNTIKMQFLYLVPGWISLLATVLSTL